MIASGQDGLLYSGESRLRIARKLAAEGLEQWKKLPVRYPTKPLSPDEQRRIIYAENILRFPVPEDVKAELFARMYPELLEENLTEGRPPKSAQAALSKIAKDSGSKPSKIKRYRTVLKAASKLAKKSGKDRPSAKEIREAREKLNRERRAKEKKKSAIGEQHSSLLTIQLTRKEADENVKVLSQDLTPLRRQIVTKIRRVLKIARK